MRTLTLLVFITSGLISFAQKADSLSLLFIGDIMGHDTQINGARSRTSDGSYDYNPSLAYIHEEIRNVDITIANLEVTLAGPPHKGYPQFSSPDQLAEACKGAGIDIFVTANNHCVDRGKQGLERTCDVLDSLEIPRTGTFKDKSDREKLNPYIFEVNNIKIALLNYTYGTNGLPVRSPNIVNLIDTISMKADIEKAKQHQPDQIIAFTHWGLEYQTTQNKKQEDLTNFLWRNGVNLVIGSHPHVVQPMHFDKEKNRVVVYSMGNFVSNQRDLLRDGGAMARITLVKEDGKCFIDNASHQLTWVHTPIINNRKIFYILPAAKYEQTFVDSDTTAHAKLLEYTEEVRKVTKNNTAFPEYK